MNNDSWISERNGVGESWLSDAEWEEVETVDVQSKSRTWSVAVECWGSEGGWNTSWLGLELLDDVLRTWSVKVNAPRDHHARIVWISLQ